MAKSTKQKNNFINPETGRTSITDAFGEELASLLSEKITLVYKSFRTSDFCNNVKKEVVGRTYTERIAIIADNLYKFLPSNYIDSLAILMKILGPENQEETGMFTNYYWLMPVGKFIEKYGLNDFKASIKAIEEVTKRSTGEYAIRPFARKYPEKVIEICMEWAKSNNFHLRRLASEGLRPKLPWAPKLDVWIDNPAPIFEILEILKEDKVKFVKKSVGNHLRDWLKVNPIEAEKIVQSWSKSKNEHTKWIIKHAQR